MIIFNKQELLKMIYTAKNYENIELQLSFKNEIHISHKDGHCIYKNNLRNESFYHYRNNKHTFKYGEITIKEYKKYDFHLLDYNGNCIDKRTCSRNYIPFIIYYNSNCFSGFHYGFFYKNYSANQEEMSINGTLSKIINLNSFFIENSLYDFFKTHPEAELFAPVADSKQSYNNNITILEADKDNKNRISFFEKNGFIIIESSKYEKTIKLIKDTYKEKIIEKIKNENHLFYIYINKELFEKRPK